MILNCRAVQIELKGHTMRYIDKIIYLSISCNFQVSAYIFRSVISVLWVFFNKKNIYFKQQILTMLTFFVNQKR